MLTPAPRKTLARGVLLLSVAAPLSLYAASGVTAPEAHPGWVQSGNVLQWGIPLAAFGLTFLLGGHGPSDGQVSAPVNRLDAVEMPGLNWPGPRLGESTRHDFLVSFVRMEIVTYGLKYTLNTRRPNGGNQSFPSGHSAAAFMGAEFIRKEYGPWWATPAYLAAGWVGYTRVESRNHYWYDVLGGALIGIASNYDFDDVKTPAGKLSVRFTAIESNPLGRTGFDGLLPTPMEPSRLVPGLRLDLRF